MTLIADDSDAKDGNSVTMSAKDINVRLKRAKVDKERIAEINARRRTLGTNKHSIQRAHKSKDVLEDLPGGIKLTFIVVSKRINTQQTTITKRLSSSSYWSKATSSRGQKSEIVQLASIFSLREVVNLDDWSKLTSGG